MAAPPGGWTSTGTGQATAQTSADGSEAQERRQRKAKSSMKEKSKSRLTRQLHGRRFVATKAPDFNRDQQNSTSRLQQVQQQSLGINRNLQISIGSGIWFGNRGSFLGNSVGPTICFEILRPNPQFSKPTHFVSWPRCSGGSNLHWD